MRKQSGRVVNRFVALVRALLPEDWYGRAGEAFRSTTESVSKFADEHRVRPKDLLEHGVELGRRKLEGVANKEYADALRSFAEAEQSKVETELKKRSGQSQVRQQEAAARLAELTVLEKEIELLKKFKDIGVIPHRDENGNLTVLPLPANCDLDELAHRWRQDKSVMPSPDDFKALSGELRQKSRRVDPRYVDGQKLLVEAMKYLAQSDPVINRAAIELLSEHVRTRFRVTDR